MRNKLVVTVSEIEPDEREPYKEPDVEDLDGVDYARRTIPKKTSRKEQLQNPLAFRGIDARGKSPAR